MTQYAQAKSFTPILNTEDFSSVFGGKTKTHLPLDEQGLLRAVESIAFPGTSFTILEEKENEIVRVESPEYPYSGPFFVDRRFLHEFSDVFIARKPSLPSAEKILQTMHNLIGYRYFWGGNCHHVPEMLSLYPPKEKIDSSLQDDWSLKGFDCSGLTYYATHGIVPRNTSRWLDFGKEVPVKEKTLEDICSSLKPLDAFVWKGHILFLYNENTVIESRIHKGVIITDLQTRLKEIVFEEKKDFVVRRWHPDFLL